MGSGKGQGSCILKSSAIPKSRISASSSRKGVAKVATLTSEAPSKPSQNSGKAASAIKKVTVIETPARVSMSNDHHHHHHHINAAPSSLSTAMPRDPEKQLVSEFLLARNMLKNASGTQQNEHQAASGSRDYVNYFLAKEGGEGSTFGRLFESYPKRTFMVHPGRVQRQKTDIVARTRLSQLLG
jgi:hypothetical protein